MQDRWRIRVAIVQQAWKRNAMDVAALLFLVCVCVCVTYIARRGVEILCQSVCVWGGKVLDLFVG